MNAHAPRIAGSRVAVEWWSATASQSRIDGRSNLSRTAKSNLSLLSCGRVHNLAAARSPNRRTTVYCGLEGRAASEETRLTPAAPISLIGTYGETQTDWTANAMNARSAKPFSAPRLSPRLARSQARRIGATLFAVIMSIIVLVLLALVFCFSSSIMF